MITRKKIKEIINKKDYVRAGAIICKYSLNKIKNLKAVRLIKNHFDNYNQLRFYREYLGPNKFVFDVGANIGKKTDLFLKLGCRVVAIEPQSDLANSLQAKYSLDKSVTVEHCGLGREDGEAVINISTKYPGFSSFNKSWQQGKKYNNFDKTEKVATTTLDNLIRKYGLPDFCKIDVEGFEDEVLAGLSIKIPMINFEFHSDDMELARKCLHRLKDIGYAKFNFVMSENSKMCLPRWLPADHIPSEIEKKEKIKKEIIWGDIYAK